MSQEHTKQSTRLDDRVEPVGHTWSQVLGEIREGQSRTFENWSLGLIREILI